MCIAFAPFRARAHDAPPLAASRPTHSSPPFCVQAPSPRSPNALQNLGRPTLSPVAHEAQGGFGSGRTRARAVPRSLFEAQGAPSTDPRPLPPAPLTARPAAAHEPRLAPRLSQWAQQRHLGQVAPGPGGAIIGGRPQLARPGRPASSRRAGPPLQAPIPLSLLSLTPTPRRLHRPPAPNGAPTAPVSPESARCPTRQRSPPGPRQPLAPRPLLARPPLRSVAARRLSNVGEGRSWRGELEGRAAGWRAAGRPPPRSANGARGGARRNEEAAPRRPVSPCYR